jgi:hypothetical protein
VSYSIARSKVFASLKSTGSYSITLHKSMASYDELFEDFGKTKTVLNWKFNPDANMAVVLYNTL